MADPFADGTGAVSSDGNDRQGVEWKAPRLYKYVSLERALGILTSGEIRMTPPRFLNDPHELSIEINPQSLMRDFRDHMVADGCDPTRAAGIAQRNVRGMVIDHVEHVVAQREKIGILSLCDQPDNMLLWAHYGQEHRGAVLELDVGELIAERTAPDDLQVLAEVEYSDERIDYIARGMPLWMTLIYKSAAWVYEREWRLMRSLTALRQKTETVHVLDLPPASIKRVIFGARAMGGDEEAAIKFLQGSADHAHVAIEKAVFTSELVGLDFRSGHDFAWTMIHGEHHFGDHWREHLQWVDLEKLERAAKGEGLDPPA